MPAGVSHATGVFFRLGAAVAAPTPPLGRYVGAAMELARLVTDGAARSRRRGATRSSARGGGPGKIMHKPGQKQGSRLGDTPVPSPPSHRSGGAASVLKIGLPQEQASQSLLSPRKARLRVHYFFHAQAVVRAPWREPGRRSGAAFGHAVRRYIRRILKMAQNTTATEASIPVFLLRFAFWKGKWSNFEV